jgi:hypothetical protein
VLTAHTISDVGALAEQSLTAVLLAFQTGNDVAGEEANKQ